MHMVKREIVCIGKERVSLNVGERYCAYVIRRYEQNVREIY